MARNISKKNSYHQDNFWTSDVRWLKMKTITLVVIVAVLVVANVTTATLWQKAERLTSDVNQSDKYSLLNPARNLIEQKDLIINFQPLRDYLSDKYETDPNVSIYFEYLPTGANIAVNKDAEFYPASLLKVPIAMAVVKKIEDREWKWTNELVLLPADKDKEFGTLYKESSNSTWTIEELIRRSMSDSDNTAHFILLRNLEQGEIEDVYDHIGLKGFLDADGNISAKRYSVILRALYNASYINEENSEKLLLYLSQSQFGEYIESGIPDDLIFPHKIGINYNERVFTDAGIIYAQNRPYLLIVMTKNKEMQEAKDLMKDISKSVYEYVTSYDG